MSKLAREEFNKARVQQTTQNDARRIYQRVDAARQNPTRAGVRWPFELIQNAHDAGPRDGDDRVEIKFALEEDRLVVSHTGKPFIAQELAALLSGGSSKEFDSEETTGRFGTGFLVTHAVSTRVDIKGVLSTQEGSEIFEIELVRDGDENSIIANIEQSNESLENAESVDKDWIASNPTASFVYHNPDSNVVNRGLDRLERALPYLYATCSRLGRVRIERSDVTKCFDPISVDESVEEGFIVSKTRIRIRDANDKNCVTTVRIGSERVQAALLLALGHCGNGEFRVLTPNEQFSRLFVRFPVAGTSILPFNVVIDGDFAISQERDGIAMSSADRALIESAFAALPTLVQHAVRADWQYAHELASIATPTQPLSGEPDSGELDWWKEILGGIAEQIAHRPIIQTKTGLLPALPVHEERCVKFPVPAINANANHTMDYGDFYRLVDSVIGLALPSYKVAEAWGDIARKWQQTGVKVERIGLRELTDRIKSGVHTINALPVNGDPYSWLTRLFQLTAETQDQNARRMVNRLLPDQNGVFVNTGLDSLYSDGGVSTEVKDIAFELDLDFRSQLLDSTMDQALMAPEFKLAKDLVYGLLDKSVGGKYTEAQAISEILSEFPMKLNGGSQFNDSIEGWALYASARMIVYLAKSNDVHKMRQCPLLTASGRIYYLPLGQRILAPIQFWPETARPYSDLYTDGRLLSNRYCNDQLLLDSLDALTVSGLALPAPIFHGRRAELNDVNLLREMSNADENSEGITVRNAEFGQIAFLARDVVQRCGQDPNLAKLLLEFVLNVAAQEDQGWRNMKPVQGSRSGEQVSLNIRESIWPFELKVRSWIPVNDPDTDTTVPMPANESNLRELLDQSWLNDNRDAVDILHEVFGFRRLTLLADRLDPEVENRLVDLAQSPDLLKAATENPDTVVFASELEGSDVSLESVREFVRDMKDDENLPEIMEKRREQLRRVRDNHELGTTVEDIVRDELEKVGFTVCRTGVGSDFEIAAETGDLAEWDISKSGQTWLVEVKATRDRQVRMTDTQAKKAVKEEDGFLLCVVPVGSNGVSSETPDIWFVAGLGERLAELCEDIDDFEERREDITGVTDDGIQLEISPGPTRVRVRSSVWEDEGIPLDQLAARLSTPVNLIVEQP